MAEFEQLKSLDTFAEGDLLHDVQAELGKIAENIADKRTPIEKKRKIVIEISFDPDNKGETAYIDYTVKSKLASIERAGGTAHIDKAPNGKPAIFIQTSLLSDYSASDPQDNVAPFGR